MTTTTKTEPATGIPVRKVSRAEMMAELQAEIADYEQRYEMLSERMATLVEWGEMKETAEVLEWCFAYRVLESLQEQTLTDGNRGTTTEPSKTSG